MWYCSFQTYLNHRGSCCIPSCSLCLRRSRCVCSNWSFKVSAADRFPSSSNLHCIYEDINITAFTQTRPSIQWQAKFKIIFSWLQFFRYCVCACAVFCVRNLKMLIQLHTPRGWMTWNWVQLPAGTTYFLYAQQPDWLHGPPSLLSNGYLEREAL